MILQSVMQMQLWQKKNWDGNPRTESRKCVRIPGIGRRIIQRVIDKLKRMIGESREFKEENEGAWKTAKDN